jgi:hypothetical protein
VTSLASESCSGSTNVVGSTCNTSGVVGNYVTVQATLTNAATTNKCQSFVPYGLIGSLYDISATTTVRIQ